MSGERYLRPKALVLGEGSLIPPDNELRPPPNRFTHRLRAAAPFSFRGGGEPDGEFPADTDVLLLRQEGERCRVADATGLYVEVRCDALVPLT